MPRRALLQACGLCPNKLEDDSVDKQSNAASVIALGIIQGSWLAPPRARQWSVATSSWASCAACAWRAAGQGLGAGGNVESTGAQVCFIPKLYSASSF